MAVLVCVAGCDGADGPGEPSSGDIEQRAARILSFIAPAPVYPGTWIEITTDRDVQPDYYWVQFDDGPVQLGGDWLADGFVASAVEHEGRYGFFFGMDQEIGSIGWALEKGPAVFVVEAVFPWGEWTEPFSLELDVADELAPTVGEVATAEFYGQPVVLHGEDFPVFGEGEMDAHLLGYFGLGGTWDGSRDEVVVPISPIEPLARDRAAFLLPAAIGDAQPGTIPLTLVVELEPAEGHAATLATRPLELTVHPPALFAVETDRVALGEHVALAQAGLVADETAWSTLALEGTFVAESGASLPVQDVEVVPTIDADGGAAFHFGASALEGALVAEAFGAARGVFEGTMTAQVAGSRNLTESEPLDVRIELSGVRQWVWLEYLPGYYESLYRFGLQAASLDLEERIQQRLAALYEGLGVRFSNGSPDGVDPLHVTRVDIGGPDPNGLGLFGFDNSPGKDIGNLRLADVIGGENAATQQDGYPGYGGVFIESYLYWQGEPLFDAVFGPVMERPAGIAELLSPSDDERAAQIEQAASALANVIAETIAHELGHAMGLANPEFHNGAFHNAEDGPGCLMDVGEERSFGERAGLPGFEPTHFCYGHDAYLAAVLSAGP